jgi:hypothetical protein
MKTFRPMLLLLAVVSLGCAGALDFNIGNFYERLTPMEYPPTEDPLVFNVDTMDEAEQLLQGPLAGMTLIGTSAFNGPYTVQAGFYQFGRRVGADIVLNLISHTGKETHTERVTLYDTTTTVTSGAVGQSTINTYTPRHETRTYDVHKYDNFSWFLRNDGKTPPLVYARMGSVNTEPTKSAFVGRWKSAEYLLRIGRSQGRDFAFVLAYSEAEREAIKDTLEVFTGWAHDPWSIGNAMYVMDARTGKGWCMARNKQPYACSWAIEPKTGYLAVTIGQRTVRYTRDQD